MLEESHDLFNKIVAIICIVVFLLSMGGFLGYTLYTESIDQQQLERIKNLSMAIEAEKERYEREISILERDLLDSLPAGSTMTLVVTSVNSELYTKLYPLLNATHELCVPEEDMALVGTMCLSPTLLPGDDGCITMDEYYELMDAGWTTAIYVSDEDVQDLGAYISNLQSILAERGIALPKVAYFEKRTYSTNYDSILISHGIEGIFHHEESGFDLICQDTESVIWRVGSVGWNTKNISPQLLEAMLTTRGNTSFTIGFDKDEPNSYFYGDIMANESIDRMLDKIREHIAEGKINVGDILYGREMYLNFIAEYNAIAPTVQEKKDEIKLLIEQLEIELLKIYSGNFTEED